MFAVIETIVTDISASTGRNDFIFEKSFRPVEAEISITKFSLQQT
jgi:hypothetical protein